MSPLCCSSQNSHISALEHSLAQIKTLDSISLDIVTRRYITLLQEYYKRKNLYSQSFHITRIIMTVGSLIVPALLSVQYTAGNVTSLEANMSAEVYWIVWVLSLLVTISNGVMSLFKVDKKYFVLNTTFEQLLSEGWQYIELSGKYSGQLTPGHTASHTNQYPYFCHMIEKIRMKQVEDEYYKVMEHSTHVHRNNNGNHDSLVPPTPFRSFGINQNQIQNQVQNQIQNQNQIRQMQSIIEVNEGETAVRRRDTTQVQEQSSSITRQATSQEASESERTTAVQQTSHTHE